MELEESLLILTKIESSSEYKSEEKTITSFALLLYTSLPSILPPQLLLSTLINSLSYYYNISHHGLIL